MNASANTALWASHDPRFGAAKSARNELSRAHQALERASLNLNETDKQAALRAADFHTSLAHALMRGKQ